MKIIYRYILLFLLLIKFNITTAQCWKIIDSGDQTLGIKSDGTLWAWGLNNYGQLGDGTTVNKSIPTKVGIDNDWFQVTSGRDHVLALKVDGTLWAWGNNTYGELGDGTNIIKLTPVQIGTSTNWKAISAGAYHSLAIKNDGTLWSWGWNVTGGLGDGTYISRNFPIQIGFEINWSQISGGVEQSHAIKNDGTLWGWGFNLHGALGDGTTVQKNIPTQIGTDNNWLIVKGATDGNHTLGIKNDGTLWGWGNNTQGQVGDGTTVQKNIPTQIGIATNWKNVKATNVHSLGIKNDNTIWSWGYNGSGQLGDGTLMPKNIPTLVGTLNDWLSVATGWHNSHALKTDGTLWGWGSNNYGQLGDGTTVYKSIPTQITFCTSPPCNITLTTTTTPDTCTAKKGTATVVASGGTGSYTYSWNTLPVQTTATATGLIGGSSYTVTVTSGTCTQTSTVTIPLISSTITLTGTPVCVPLLSTVNNGNITLTTSGGTAPFTYLWSNSATSKDLINVPSGSYTVTVTDVNGCTATGTYTLACVPACTCETANCTIKAYYLLLPSTTKNFIECNNEIQVPCNQPISFSATIACPTTCIAILNETLKDASGNVLATQTNVSATNPLNFTFTTSGTYTLTGSIIVNGVVCKTCEVKIVVTCQIDCCKGSYWKEEPAVKDNTGKIIATLNCKNPAPFNINKKYCNQDLDISGIYNCADSNCTANVVYSLYNSSGLVSTSNTIFTIPAGLPNGNYTFTIQAYCNDSLCSQCEIKIKKDCPPLPPSPCKNCDTQIINSTTVSALANTFLNGTEIVQSFAFTGLSSTLTNIRATVEKVTIYAVDEKGKKSDVCLKCITNPITWGSLINGSGIPMPATVLVNGIAKSLPFIPSQHHNPREINWANGGSTFSLTSPIQLHFVLPLKSSFPCCTIKASICIKFTFRNDKCEDCEILKCFDIEIK